MLPDELILLICLYLSTFDVINGFNDLNIRLNETIIDYRREIKLIGIKYGQFDQYCNMLLKSSLGFKIRSLNISNNRPVKEQITYFAKQICPFNKKLPNLERLRLVGITSE